MKRIIISLMSILLMIGLVSAIYSPMPIDGKVYAQNPSGIIIKATNQRTGESMTTTVNSAGEYLMDWANSYNGYLTNDTFTVQVVGCSDSVCTQTVTFTKQPELFMTFDLFDIIIPTTTTTTTTVPTCDSCCPYISCSSCCPTTTIYTTTTTIPCEKCPTINYDWLKAGGVVAILAVIAVAVGAYKGKVQIRYYQKYVDPITKKNKYRWVILFSRSD
jgi:hypothetical protein